MKKMSEDEKMLASKKVVQIFKDTLSLNQYDFWMKLYTEDLMGFKNAAIPVFEEMLDESMMEKETTANQFEKLILYAPLETVDLVVNSYYNYSEFLENMGAVEKQRYGYEFVKPLGYWKIKIQIYERMTHHSINVSEEYKQKLYAMDNERFFEIAKESYMHFKFLQHILNSYKRIKESFYTEFEEYEKYGIEDKYCFDIIIAYYQGIYNLMVRSSALLNYVYLEHQAKLKSKEAYSIKDYMHPSAWLLGLDKTEIYRLAYENACSNNHVNELVVQLVSDTLDISIMAETRADQFCMFEKALIIHMGDKKEGLRLQTLVLKELATRHNSLNNNYKYKRTAEEMLSSVDSKISKLLSIGYNYHHSNLTKDDYESTNKVDLTITLNDLRMYKKCYEAIINNLHSIYEADKTLIKTTERVYNYYTDLVDLVNAAIEGISNKKLPIREEAVKITENKKTSTREEKVRKTEKKKTEPESKTVSIPITEKERPIEIQPNEFLNAYKLISKATQEQRAETSKEAHRILSVNKDINVMINQFEILLLSDYGQQYNDASKVKKIYEKARSKNEVYGALGEALSTLKDARVSLKKKQPSSFKKMFGVIGAALTIGIMFVVLNSKMTAFLWSADMEKNVSVIAIIIMAVIGLLSEGIVGGVIGLFGGALLMVLIISMFSISKILKFICIVLFVILALIILIIGFSNEEDDDDKKLKEDMKTVYNNAISHINHLLYVLRVRDKEYDIFKQYYEDVKKQFDDNKIE